MEAVADTTFMSRVSSVKAVELALRKNTIVVTETENGKEVLLLMMIREIEKWRLKDEFRGKKLISFLAPTVHLVQKHLKEIKLYTELDVEGYYGAKGVDDWNAITWEKEIEHDVFVMTPQVMLDALRKAYIKLDLFCFVIIDECHEATGNHPFAKMMKEFHVEKLEGPKIFGITSSLAIRRGSSSENAKKERVAELESLLNFQVHVVEDSSGLEEVFSIPKLMYRFYDPVQPLDLILKDKLEISWSRFEASMARLRKMMDPQKMMEKTLEPLLNRFSSDFAEILFCLTDLGTASSLEAVKCCIENAQSVPEEFIHAEESVLQYKIFLHETLAIIEEHMKLLDFGCGKEPLPRGQISSKLQTLFEIFRLLRDKKEFLGIIFVKRIFLAKVIAKVINQTPDLCHLSISYSTKSDLVGNMLLQLENSEPFHSGKVNLLFSADVPEEGIDAVKCSCVIGFDLPESVHSYVQSRKLAPQRDSLYIIMLERGNPQQIDRIWNNITNMSSIPTCECLVEEESPARCRENLQLVAALEPVVCREAHKDNIEKYIVDLNGSEIVQEMGTPTHHVLPSIENCSEKSSVSSEKDLASGEGTTKRKELHGSINVSTLYGTWGHGDSFLYAYKMRFLCSIPEQTYSSFVLLLEKKLEDDVGHIEIELFLLSKSVKCCVSFDGGIYLDAQKVDQAKCFQELIFNGLFGKLFVEASGGRTFLLQTGDSLWLPSNMYLLLPLESESASSFCAPSINWEGIKSCVSAAEFLKSNALFKFFRTEVTGGDSSASALDQLSVKYDGSLIHLANKSASPSGLKEMVVVAVHTGKIYSVLDIIPNSSSASPFEDVAKYSTFSDYFLKKYGIVLKHPEQPLLLLKQSHNSHNLLVDFRTEGERNNMERKPQQHACMPPELLVLTNIRTDVLKPFYLLPSVMHRLESLMLASQLREEISDDTGNFRISSSLILEALTTLRCCEMFSMERLEFLGDAVLKYVVSCHLFLKHAEINERILTSSRSSIISNMNLHKLGINRKLQRYIRDSAFDPQRWMAPGQRSICPCPCDHEVETSEVPYESRFFSEDTKILGKTCDKGHRWLCSKTISDCVEALIGAYYVGGGLTAALGFMKWLGIEAEFGDSLIDDVIISASFHSFPFEADDDINILESKIDYRFSCKRLLLEAVTHKSRKDNISYERLEFLGDAVLGLLITQYLYENHSAVDPGELSDLRSWSVSNDNFAMAAVKWKLHPHLRHGSTALEKQISDFVHYMRAISTSSLNSDAKAPKALGDLVESIAGAVLIDSKLNLSEVWRVLEPILSPIVTPETLELQPIRALNELCDNLGYNLKPYFFKDVGEYRQAELRLQLENVLLTSKGLGSTEKVAKEKAARQMLEKLESTGIAGKKNGTDKVAAIAAADDMEQPHDGNKQCKKQKLEQQESIEEGSNISENTDIPTVLAPMDILEKKGEARTSLYALCKRFQWPVPTFETTELKSRIPIQFGDATGFSSFESKIKLIIPGTGNIEVSGEARPNKKSSYDSAALLMLYELQKLEAKQQTAEWSVCIQVCTVVCGNTSHYTQPNPRLSTTFISHNPLRVLWYLATVKRREKRLYLLLTTHYSLVQKKLATI